MRAPWVSKTRSALDREEMIKMVALGGLLLMIVVVATIVFLAGLAWLARHDVREDESPPQEIVSPNLPNQRFWQRQATSARYLRSEYDQPRAPSQHARV